MTPLVSIVIPVHDQAPRLRLTLSALARQRGIDRDAWEVIVVDDGSTDDVDGAVAKIEPACGATLTVIRSRSRGRRGVPRNVGAETARGELLIFLDADACPAESFVAAHIAAQRRERCVGLGEHYVVPGTTSLLDPSLGIRFPRIAPDHPSVADVLLVRDVDWSDGVETFFLPHSEKGVYPDQSIWQAEIERALRCGTKKLAWVGVVPHNISVPRHDFMRLGGFDALLTHSEGWDLGLRARRAGLDIRLAEGGRSFHLYHWRPLSRDLANIRQSQRILCDRFPEEMPESAYAWFAATAGDPHIPAELNFQNWRTVESALETRDGRLRLRRIYQTMTDATRGIGLMDYLDGVALNSPMVPFQSPCANT